jgi:hypothetical protein
MTFFMVWDALLSLLCLGASIAIGVYLSQLGVWTYGSDTAHMYRTSFATALLLSYVFYLFPDDEKFLILFDRFFLTGTAVHAFFLRKNSGKQRQQDMVETKLNSDSV